MRSFAFATALLCASAPSFAAYTLQVSEVGGNVVAQGSGTLNTTSLTTNGVAGGYNALVFPSGGAIFVGPEIANNTHNWVTISGPSSIGSGGALVIADSGSGDKVGVQVGSTLVVPDTYVSGAPLLSESTWNAATFASLGLTPGQYVWTWGSGANADSFTLRIGLVQTITFTSTPPAGVTPGGAPYAVSATGGGSGNPVVFTIDPAAAGVCSIAGTNVSFNAVGTCVINANQAGGAGFAPATQQQQNINVAAVAAVPSSIPTLSEWGLIIMSSLIAMFGIARVRRRSS